MEFKQIQSIIRDFEKSNMTVLEIETEEFKIRLSKNSFDGFQTVQEIVKKSETEEKIVEKEDEKEVVVSGYEVKSPLVGTFYEASSPKAQAFVKVGQQVNKGDTICIIEAMKIMNEITSPVSGTILTINVKNGEPIGYDQIIMVIESE